MAQTWAYKTWTMMLCCMDNKPYPALLHRSCATPCRRASPWTCLQLSHLTTQPRWPSRWSPSRWHAHGSQDGPHLFNMAWPSRWSTSCYDASSVITKGKLVCMWADDG